LRDKLFSDQAVKTYSGGKPNYTQPEEKFYKQAVDGTIFEAYMPAKGGLLPKREPSGSWTSWDNTMCNPLADARMQTQSAWQDGYDSAKAKWVGLTDDEVKEIIWNLPYEPSQEHIRAIEAKLKEKNGGASERNIQTSDKGE
jgi:hypothetical protein